MNIFNSACYSAKEKISSYAVEYTHSTTRQNLLYTKLFNNSLDIICLQEVNLFMMTQLKHKCRNYDLIFHGPTQSIAQATSNNCCVLYKKSFKLLGQRRFDLNNAVSKYFMNCSSENQCEIQDAFIRELNRRNSTATMILLQRADVLLGICNCHIHWNPLYPDIKAFHVYLIVKEFFQLVHETLRDFPHPPLLLMGDFNSTPHMKSESAGPHLSAVYELITTGMLAQTHPEHPAELRKNEVFQIFPSLTLDPFKSVFHEINGKEPLFTNKTPNFCGCIDFIFYKDLIPISAKTIPQNLHQVKTLPNLNFPSDHVLLISDFFLI
ncbi:carbon catabolite repressor protein 4, putative [Plasmodium malariae]|uniref:Carbon catabolite repressor protein 4, putative n=1 Tax=Plasmodium malariae TaxID=5858 RepID=A0A1C3K9L8_PLAMA|nr:carbon catabolite repressor protein 4, putative [Plasmodium malariae]